MNLIAAGGRWNSPALLKLVSALLGVVIFVIDTVTPLEIAIAVFYIFIVLMAMSYTDRRGVAGIALVCVLLTVVSYGLSFRGQMQSGLINMGISVAAIGITTYLALAIEAARQSAQQAREQLSHVGRINALGELTASIAHEVNQPLTAVVASGNACLRWLAAPEPNLRKAQAAVERIVADANRASDVVVRVRGLVQQAPGDRSALQINEVISQVVTLLQSDMQRQGIVLQLQLQEPLPPVAGDRVQLQQVMLNLLINAREALIDAGTTQPQIHIRSSHEAGARRLQVSVCDNGPGVPDAGQRQQMFEAFYSTKPGGMGVGLAITSSIIEYHEGRIRAEPNTPQGLCIHFELPVREAARD